MINLSCATVRLLLRSPACRGPMIRPSQSSIHLSCRGTRPYGLLTHVSKRAIPRPASLTLQRLGYNGVHTSAVQSSTGGIISQPLGQESMGSFYLVENDIQRDDVEVKVGKLAVPWLQLRDACTCSRCVDPSTRQKLFEFADIPENVRPSNVRIDEQGDLELTWKNDISPRYDGHKTTVPKERFDTTLNAIGHRDSLHNKNFSPVSWTRKDIEQDPESITFGYSDYLHHDSVLLQVAQQLLVKGLVFIKDVPLDPSSVQTVAERIGPLKNTFYGSTWDVKSVPSAINVAYTSSHLGFHQDLLYMADPPFLQFLHVMKSSASGGHSLFADTSTAFDELQSAYPEYARTLLHFPVTYHYKNGSNFYEYTRSTVGGSKNSTTFGKRRSEKLAYPYDYEYINYSPPFQGPFQHSRLEVSRHEGSSELSLTLEDYRKAIAKFRDILESKENIYETKMDEGTCVIFNNRRIVHARTAFENLDGERWLRGTYIDKDPLMSVYRSLDAINRKTRELDSRKS